MVKGDMTSSEAIIAWNLVKLVSEIEMAAATSTEYSVSV
jgi:hypothetical protein